MTNAIIGLAVGILTLSSAASARDLFDDTPKVEITSFYFTGRDRTAEICGTVTGKFTAAHRVQLTIDPGLDAGTYVALPGDNGHWCALVNSRSGKAEAKLWDARGKTTTSRTIVEFQASR